MSDSRDLLIQIEEARRAVLDEGRPEAVAKRRSFKMQTARERVTALVDRGELTEFGSLVEPHRDNELNRDLVAPADGITGTGKIEGRYVNVGSHDYTVHGGSSGKVGGLKLARAVTRSIERGMPLVMLLEGGGHRIQDGMNAAHFAGASPVFQNMARTSGWIPTVAAMMGQGFAGPTNYSALSDFVVMVRGNATMGMAGPALVKAGTGVDISKEELGGAKLQADMQGIADLSVESEAECLAAAAKFLSYLPSNARAPLPILDCGDPTDRRDDSLFDLVPADSRKVYDVRKVIAVIADRDSVFELKPGFAGNIVTAFARLGGRPVGFVANQTLRKGGILDTPACEKASHFIGMCDAFGLPLVFLIDVPGFAIGPSAEATGLGRRSGRLFYELGIATVPRASVVLRKGYGGGYYAMCGGRSFEADVALAWPTAEIAVMGADGAVNILYRRELAAAEDPEALRTKLAEEYREKFSSPYLSASKGLITDIIEPSRTRNAVALGLRSLLSKRESHPPKKHGNIPL